MRVYIMGSKADNLPNMSHAYTGLREKIFALCDICTGFNSSALVISCIFPLTARRFPDVYIFSLCFFILCSYSVIPFSSKSLIYSIFLKYLTAFFFSLLKYMFFLSTSTVNLYWKTVELSGGRQKNSLPMLDRQEIDTKIIQTKPFALLSSPFF